MKNLFKNKITVVLLVVSVLLVGTTSFISALGYTSYVRNAIGIVLTPVQRGFNYVFDGMSNVFSSKEDYRRLKKENEMLENKIAELENELAKAELAQNENAELREFFGIKQEHLDCSFENAKITGRQSGTYNNLYTLNKGTFHGIKPGMPVIDSYGLIGCVSEVGLTWCKVSPITEPDLSVGVTVEKNGESGICKGSFSAAKEGFCVLSYLEKDALIEIGDRIVTSDESEKYPKGIPVGTVARIENDPLTRETIAYITPTARLDSSENVMIITEFEATYE